MFCVVRMLVCIWCFDCYLSLTAFLCDLTFSGFWLCWICVLDVTLLRFAVCLNLNVCWFECLFGLYKPVFLELGVFTHFLRGGFFWDFAGLVFALVCGFIGLVIWFCEFCILLFVTILWFDVSFRCLGLV